MHSGMHLRGSGRGCSRIDSWSRPSVPVNGGHPHLCMFGSATDNGGTGKQIDAR